MDRTSAIRLHFPTTVSTVPLYLGYRLSMSKSSHCYLLQLDLSQYTCVPFYREESIIHNKVKAQCSLVSNSQFNSTVCMHLSVCLFIVFFMEG